MSASSPSRRNDLVSSPARETLVATLLGLLLGTLFAAQGVGGVGWALALGLVPLAIVRTRQSAGFFLGCMGVLLIGYMFCGRGVAYRGFPPLYVGELALGVGLLTVLQRGRYRGALRSPVAPFLVLNALWGALCTVPYLGEYGLDALRDAVVWGYSCFSLLLLATLVGHRRFHSIARVYRFVLWPIVLYVPAIKLLESFAPFWIPRDPFYGIPLVEVRSADLSVHLAGAFAFVVLGLDRVGARRWRSSTLRRSLWTVAWIVAFFFAATSTRGGMLAMCGSLSLLLVAVRPSRWLAPVALGALVLAVIALAGMEIYNPNRGRTASVEQLIDNVRSLGGGGNQAENMAGTRRGRLEWWGVIVDYAALGPHWLTGKGYGINLAVDDGVHPPSSTSPALRHPHNIHMNILGHSGLPGLLLWLATQVAFLVVVWRGYQRAGSTRSLFHQRFLMWVLVYWAAFHINGLFTGVLVGPHGGIWFWCVVGMGLASARAVEMGRHTARTEQELGSEATLRAFLPA